jgi:hypothetical protein
MREQEPGHGIDRNAGRRGNRLGVSRVSEEQPAKKGELGHTLPLAASR